MSARVGLCKKLLQGQVRDLSHGYIFFFVLVFFKSEVTRNKSKFW